MQLVWQIDSKDVALFSSLVKAQSSNPLVLDRIRRNVERRDLDVSAKATWRRLVGCFATTQQPSGKDSKVAKFMASDNDILDLEVCQRRKDFSTHAANVLAVAGLRRNVSIGKQLESALPHFSNGDWRRLEKSLRSIFDDNTNLASERACSRVFRATFHGLGPKQSRNLLQALGLTRYVVPLDSRFTKHLNEVGFPIPLSASALQDEAFYSFIEDGIQRLAEVAGVLPCVYDAVVFASFD